MRFIHLAVGLCIALPISAQQFQRPMVTSDDTIDGPMGGEHRVERLQIFGDGRIAYSTEVSGADTAGKAIHSSYQATIDGGEIRELVHILSLPEIRSLPANVPSKTRPIDFFWDKSIQISRPEGNQNVHIENFYPFLNLKGEAYPQALIQLECALQRVETASAKRPKEQDDWREALLNRGAARQESPHCTDDPAEPRIVAGEGWG